MFGAHLKIFMKFKDSRKKFRKMFYFPTTSYVPFATL